ncbi:hypothetical protein OFC53_34090, partial [Escherichia coli]|nr:hypothetical protein [Escherichia coli]
YANEFGGVETGKIMPSEAENATTTSKPCKPPTAAKLGMETPIAAAIGINKFAVAVFDIKLAINQHTMESATTTANGDSAS